MQADIWKGNTAYLGGCDDAMAPYTDPHDSTVVHHGYCDPFEYPMDPEDRVNGWQLNASDFAEGELTAALGAYKEDFELVSLALSLSVCLSLSL